VSAYYNSSGESSLSTSYAYATTYASSSETTLSNNVWYQSYLNAGEVHYYNFYANYAGTYDIYWEDRDYDSSRVDIKVSVTDSYGYSFYYQEDVGHNGRSIYVSSPGTIMLIVEGYNSISSSGNYRIRYRSN
jgi:hypothetical protein